MAIEFRCTNCEKLLRTEAGTEGKKAKCPQCGTVLTVPFSSTAGFVAPAPAPSFEAPPPREPDYFAAPAAQAAANPYRSPSTYGRAEATVERGFHPSPIEFGETFRRTWEIFKANLGMCLAGTLVMWFCSGAIGFLLQFIVSAGFHPNDEAGMIAMIIAQQLVGQAVNAFFMVGLILFMLRIARGEPAEIGLLFGGGPFFLRAFLIQIIVFLAMFGGLLLLIVPGIIFGLMLSQAQFMLVDQRAGIGDSLKMSIEAMKGNKLTVLAIWLVAGIGGLLIGVFTCCIGFLFVGPFGMLLMSVIYLGVTGQRTVLDVAVQPTTAEREFGAPGVQPT